MSSNDHVRVLIVDDDPAILDGLRRSLRRIAPDWTVRFAQDGAEALMSLKLQPVDVIVSDIRMPNMHGVALLNRLADRYPDILRVAFSDKYDALTVYSLTDCSHAYIAKPCSAEHLVQLIVGQLTEYKQRQDLASNAISD
jgi:DNA-binding NtrC family response regulator